MMRWMVALAAALAQFASGVQAHHSIFSIYDSKRQATLEGTVAEFHLVNPHPFLFIEVDEAGAMKRWRLEMDNRSELAEIGVTATTFRPGDRVIVGEYELEVERVAERAVQTLIAARAVPTPVEAEK